LRDPVVVFLLLAGFFDGISGNPIHSILLFSAAVALAWDATVGARTGRPAVMPRPAAGATKGRPLTPLVMLGALIYAAVVGSFGRYSWPATAAVVVPAAALIAVAWRGPVRGGPGAPELDPAGATAWASAFVALSLWELANLFLQPTLTTDSYAHPTLSVLTDPIIASHPGRSIMLFAWLAFGWFLVGR
jgi:hypothetical protein